jgi:predicted ATPase
MKLLTLTSFRYRSLREETIRLTDLNVFIGTNASGKSTILDALRFLHEGLRERDFSAPVGARGGILHLAWKGNEAHDVRLVITLEDDGGRQFEWSVAVRRGAGYTFTLQEDLYEPPAKQLLRSESGQGWWLSEPRDGKAQRVTLNQSPTACALAAAAANESFPARAVAAFVQRWGFFDPNPFILRRGWSGFDPARFDTVGRNLAERLYAIRESSPATFDSIVAATQSVLGLPTRIDFREPREPDERVYFVQHEPGLSFPVHQIGASSGTLRMLALMTALFGESENGLIGLEEPENHVHPTALAAFAEYLRKARSRVQLLVTTHSPLLLDYLDDAEAVCIVRHTPEKGTYVTRESNAAAVKEALVESGFGLGDFYATKGFGA